MRLPAIESRLAELLADRALLGLNEPESAELRGLLRDEPGVDEWALERAATALFVGMAGLALEAPPASVRVRLETAGDHFAASRRPTTVADQTPTVVSRVGRASPAFAWLAAAACLALAAVAWWPARPGAPIPADPIALADASADAISIAWAPGPDETGKAAQGRVVWSDASQAGYMEFRGLPSLDPARWQYQLWIVDPARDQRPVDGGVFDVPASGEALVRVPIDAKLRVDRPVAFVVTVEQPGGVVVSSQERVALIAARSD